jgi:ABC-2 type transport system permease protein
MIVLQAFSTRKPYLVLVAILYHALIDAAAVYTVATTNQYWVAFLVFFALLVPGWAWLARLWRYRDQELAATDEKSPPAIPLRTSTALFLASLRKEILYLWRTWRVLIVCAVMFVFAIMSPLLTKFTPQLLGAIEGAEMFADLIPEMSVVDSLKQHIETMTQFGFILVILLGMGAVAGEKEQGTAGMVLSKPLSRGAFLLSKFFSQVMLYLLGFIIALGAGYYYTDVLFGDLEAATFLGINALLLLWLLVFASITLLGSSLGNSTGAAAGFALAGSILLIILGSLPNIGALLPNGILGWAAQVAEGSQDTFGNWGAVALSIVIILMALVSALGIFERQELR